MNVQHVNSIPSGVCQVKRPIVDCVCEQHAVRRPATVVEPVRGVIEIVHGQHEVDKLINCIVRPQERTLMGVPQDPVTETGCHHQQGLRFD